MFMRVPPFAVFEHRAPATQKRFVPLWASPVLRPAARPTVYIEIRRRVRNQNVFCFSGAPIPAHTEVADERRRVGVDAILFYS